MRSTQLIDLFQRARKDRGLAVIEGVQALKHAVRFDAEIKHYITCDIAMLKSILGGLAPDTLETVLAHTEEVSEEVFSKLSPQPPRTKVIALAQRKSYQIKDLALDKPIVLLEDPRDLENIGAVIRVSAAVDISGVSITGPVDIWNPAIIRGAAGLHFALPVLNIDIEKIIKLPRPLVALDPTGEENIKTIASNSILVFGTERSGISQSLLGTADRIIRLPMKSGVSSLNLATSVAATLYSTKHVIT